MKCFFSMIVGLTLTGFTFGQDIPPRLSLQQVGGKIKTSTPTAQVAFHPGGITLTRNNGDVYEFTFEDRLLGANPEIRKTKVGEELWYPRLYRGIDLRCFVKADGEIGYDWRLGPNANPSDVKMDVSERLAGSASSDVRALVSK